VTLQEAVQWLLDNKYAVLVNGELTLTQKLTKDLEVKVVKTTKRGYGTDEERRDLWADFVAEADIPHAAFTQTGRYWLRPYSNEGVVNLIKVLNKPGVVRQKLVDSTKRYYQEAAFKKTLLSYLRDGLWEDMYNSYLASPQVSRGANPFEQ
jgi:hypothetical protein